MGYEPLHLDNHQMDYIYFHGLRDDGNNRDYDYYKDYYSGTINNLRNSYHYCARHRHDLFNSDCDLPGYHDSNHYSDLNFM